MVTTRHSRLVLAAWLVVAAAAHRVVAAEPKPTEADFYAITTLAIPDDAFLEAGALRFRGAILGYAQTDGGLLLPSPLPTGHGCRSWAT